MTTHAILTAIVCAAFCSQATIKVWDGDTIRIGAESIRLLNIDAPEIGDKARCQYEAALATQARNRLVAILSSGDVVIVRHGLDKYGRTLAVVLVDGNDAGDALVAAGLARTWTGRREPWC